MKIDLMKTTTDKQMQQYVSVAPYIKQHDY